MIKIAGVALALGSFTPVQACDYAGVYELIDDVMVRVDCRSGGLRIERFGFLSRRLTREGRDRFTSADGQWWFQRDVNGKIVGFIERRNGRSLGWKRR